MASNNFDKMLVNLASCSPKFPGGTLKNLCDHNLFWAIYLVPASSKGFCLDPRDGVWAPLIIHSAPFGRSRYTYIYIYNIYKFREHPTKNSSKKKPDLVGCLSTNKVSQNLPILHHPPWWDAIMPVREAWIPNFGRKKKTYGNHKVGSYHL